MPRFHWSTLSKQQVGTYFEYFTKMELTMFGFDVFTTEVDDRGIDFVARRQGGQFIEVQAKAVRSLGYVFLRKTHFKPDPTRFVALGILNDGQEPKSYLIPSTVWHTPNQLFVDRNYDKPELKSAPEWGINVSTKNLPLLEPFKMEQTLDCLCKD